MSGIWLGIDTTSSVGGVALVKNDLLLKEFVLPVKGFNSEKLLPAVERALKESNIEGSDLTGIGVSIGPGSYTGLRIGLSTVLGLSSGWKIPVKGVPTLRVIAASLPEVPILSCIKARNGEVFAGAFSSSDPLSEEILKQALYSSGELKELLLERQLAAAGSGRTEISCRGLKWASPLLDNPKPSHVAFCASSLSERDGYDRKLEPLYLREFNQRIHSK